MDQVCEVLYIDFTISLGVYIGWVLFSIYPRPLDVIHIKYFVEKVVRDIYMFGYSIES